MNSWIAIIVIVLIVHIHDLIKTKIIYKKERKGWWKWINKN